MRGRGRSGEDGSGVGESVLKQPFPMRDGHLRAGSQAVEDLAARFGTPLYVYDAEIIRDRYRMISEAFAPLDPLIAYSVKANGNLAVLDLLAGLGAGADIVSGGELYRARTAGIPADRILFAGVGKTENEIRYALREGIWALNVESRQELEAVSRVAESMNGTAPVALRLNPNIVSPTPHEYTRTGHLATKFGIGAEQVLELYEWASRDPHLEVRGIDVHIGSQISSADPFLAAVDQVLEMVDRLDERGINLQFVDLGGGFGVPYDDEPGLAVGDLANALVERFRGRELRLVLEPGRFLVGEAGVLLTRVLYLKKNGSKTFAVVDGGMTELLRPSHYGGYHRITSASEPESAVQVSMDVVGPICETGDFLAKDRTMPLPEPGDLLAVHTAGAYGFAMASNYNGRPRAAEVLVDGDSAWVVRERETIADLVRGERIPKPLAHSTFEDEL